MSSLAPEQLVATQKTSVETMVAILNKAFGGIERLVELNVQAVKSSLAKIRKFWSTRF
ncbi:phasin family protein [Paraburkholderia kirstenboschensis]|uniref:Phasin family protein n=1 Tax=Paraburkholderia kirstenboschensis TaxID=1245436 RepID=A0ABZ0EJD6_9BURK|nr:phasin family protein [Paraburkholderia kirstenboschensis]WOD17055.1 phasin family protein [Paraburkholderia kirstenboschensis]